MPILISITSSGLQIEEPLTATKESIPMISCQTATVGDVGVVKPDGTTITIDPDGTIHAPGGGGGGFPSVVAAVNFIGQTATLGPITLLANPATGDYVLNDFFLVTGFDGAASVTFTADFATEFGPAEITGTTGPAQMIPSLVTSLAGSFLSPIIGVAVPTTIHAVAGTPISVTVTLVGATTLVFDYHATLVQNQ